MVCSGLMLACAEGPESETTTIVLDSMGDEMDQADEVETDESDASSSESGDSDDSSTSGSDDSSTSGSDDDTSTSSTSTSTTSTDTNDTNDTNDTSESTTGDFGQCGWDEQNSYYECGFQGADPGGTPIACPPGLVENDSCSNTGLTGQGCCDGNGDNWYCAEGDFVFLNPCG